MTPPPVSGADERRVARLRDRFPEFDFTDLEVAMAVQRASMAVDRTLAAQISSYGLTPVALQTLISVYLSSDGPLSLTDLGEELRVTKANISLVLGGLEKQKLIRRKADPNDGRRIRASVTKKGEKILREVMPVALGAVEASLTTLGKRDRDKLKQLSRGVGTGE